MTAAAKAGKKRMLTALFADSDAAEQAYQACNDRGYEIGQVNVVVSEGTRKKFLADDYRGKAELGRRRMEGGEPKSSPR